MLRDDTECRCYEDDLYKINLWGFTKYDSAKELSDVKWCFLILRFLGCMSGFTVTWWKIPKLRVVQKGVFPTRAEVNGGWAYPGTNAVWIYRDEEWDRVLIHECIHALLWDISPVNGLKSCLETSLNNGNLTDALFEAATELNAEWLWTIIHSPSDDLTCKTWIKQVEWQQKQALEILARTDSVRGWTEDTSVFAYYVLKAVLAEDMGYFLINWLPGTATSNDWCGRWELKKGWYYQEVAKISDSVNTVISTRMTNPVLDSRK
jgi:hypothetical protein